MLSYITDSFALSFCFNNSSISSLSFEYDLSAAFFSDFPIFLISTLSGHSSINTFIATLLPENWIAYSSEPTAFASSSKIPSHLTFLIMNGYTQSSISLPLILEVSKGCPFTVMSVVRLFSSYSITTVFPESSPEIMVTGASSQASFSSFKSSSEPSKTRSNSFSPPKASTISS